MLNMFLWAGILIFSFSLFDFSYRYGGARRSFLLLNKALPESCLVIADQYGTIVSPYFDLPSVETAANSYFAISLKNYVSEYQVSCLGFDSATGISEAGRPTKITIALSAVLGRFGLYSDTVCFAVKEGLSGGR